MVDDTELEISFSGTLWINQGNQLKEIIMI